MFPRNVMNIIHTLTDIFGITSAEITIISNYSIYNIISSLNFVKISDILYNIYI